MSELPAAKRLAHYQLCILLAQNDLSTKGKREELISRVEAGRSKRDVYRCRCGSLINETRVETEKENKIEIEIDKEKENIYYRSVCRDEKGIGCKRIEISKEPFCTPWQEVAFY